MAKYQLFCVSWIDREKSGERRGEKSGKSEQKSRDSPTDSDNLGYAQERKAAKKEQRRLKHSDEAVYTRVRSGETEKDIGMFCFVLV